jgi:hypothetical protein
MDQRIEGEYEVTRSVPDARQGHAVILDEHRMFDIVEGAAACIDALLREINADVTRTARDQEFRPAAEPRCNLEDAVGRQQTMQARVQRPESLRLTAPPGARPFLAARLPIILAVPGCRIPSQIRHCFRSGVRNPDTARPCRGHRRSGDKSEVFFRPHNLRTRLNEVN